MRVEDFLKQHFVGQVIRYLLSGGTVALTELVVLYLFTDLLHVWYLFSFFVAFFVAFCVSFALQKFWTFGDRETEGIHRQAFSYFLVTIGNFLFNTLALYILVEYAGVWYLAAQFLINIVIAIANFVIYKFIIFKKREKEIVV